MTVFTLEADTLSGPNDVGLGPISDVAFDPAVAPGEHEGLLASLFRIVPTDPHIR